jgi:hypothetical protein
VLAVEEVGKAGYMMALSLLPEKHKRYVRVGRIPAWLELKLAGGMMLGLNCHHPSLLTKPVLHAEQGWVPALRL